VNGWAVVADAVLVAHGLFVAFVVVGQGLVLAGVWRGWAWVRSLRFRIAHLVSIGVVVLQAWLGVLCPLTVLENWLRLRAGEAAYGTSFVQYWLHRVLFYDAEPWVFTAIYTAFGALVVATWLLAPPRRRDPP
jgi:polyferredoxin